MWRATQTMATATIILGIIKFSFNFAVMISQKQRADYAETAATHLVKAQ